MLTTLDIVDFTSPKILNKLQKCQNRNIKLLYKTIERMGKSCYICKKEIGMLTIRQYSKSEIMDLHRPVPDGMTEHDKICFDCWESLNKLHGEQARETIQSDLFCKHCGKELPSSDADVVVSFIQKMRVKRETVNINIQTVLALVPIVDLWAAYRIEKFRVWCMLSVGFLLLDVSISLIIPDPYYVIIVLIIEIPIAVYLMRMWSKEWNAKVLTNEHVIKPNIPSLDILKERYANGEITKEEFDKMKEDVKD